MNYTYPIEEYITQLKKNNELDSITFTPNDSKEYVLSKLEERSTKKREIASIINTMIYEYIERFEKDPSLMTETDAEMLDSFANLLLPVGKKNTDIEVTDHAIYFRLAKLLVQYYKNKNDLNKYILALNRCSNGYMILINGHSFYVKDSLFTDECIELSKKYLDSDILNEDMKTKLLVLLARESITAETHFPVDKFKYILNAIRTNMHEEPTQYEILNLLFYTSTVLQLFREHLIWAKDNNVLVNIESAKDLIEEVCGILEYMAKKFPSIDSDGDISMHILSAKYFIGEITLDELLKKINEIKEEMASNSNPTIQARGLCFSSHLYLNILYRFSDLPKQEIYKLSQECVKEVLPKLMGVAREVNSVYFNRNIVEFLTAASLTGSFDDFAQVILECTVYADKALYIHTLMVKEMSRAIFDYMIDETPEVFNGVMGKDTNYIKEHKEEMKKLLDECAMFHDIGKFFMLEIVENSIRRLTDDEFSLIKEHPEHFIHIYQNVDESDERVLCIRDCALTHHLWYDGSKGYPSTHHTKNRPFVDILAIADSIDAATDFYGRPYNKGKTIDELILEFKAKAGTQYAPIVIEALSNKNVKDKLAYLITLGRKDIYYRIYAFNRP